MAHVNQPFIVTDIIMLCLMRHLLDEHIPVGHILGSLGDIGVKPFSVTHRYSGYRGASCEVGPINRHNRSMGVDAAVFGPSH